MQVRISRNIRPQRDGRFSTCKAAAAAMSAGLRRQRRTTSLALTSSPRQDISSCAHRQGSCGKRLGNRRLFQPERMIEVIRTCSAAAAATSAGLRRQRMSARFARTPSPEQGTSSKTLSKRCAPAAACSAEKACRSAPHALRNPGRRPCCSAMASSPLRRAALASSASSSPCKDRAPLAGKLSLASNIAVWLERVQSVSCRFQAQCEI